MSLRPCRSQADMIQRDVSKASALTVFGPSKSRQEFRGDCDVNTVVRRYAAGDVPLRSVQYGEQDFSLDATQAHQMLHELGDVYQALPVELRKKYPSPLDLARGMKRGEVLVTDKSRAQHFADFKAAREAEIAAAVAAATPPSPKP